MMMFFSFSLLLLFSSPLWWMMSPQQIIIVEATFHVVPPSASRIKTNTQNKNNNYIHNNNKYLLSSQLSCNNYYYDVKKKHSQTIGCFGRRTTALVRPMANNENVNNNNNDNNNKSNNNNKKKNVLNDLQVAIVGGGPSGLLLAHGLVQAGATVHVYEKRSRPKQLELEKRAYALGIGLRGRSAIQQVDSNYWNNNNNNNKDDDNSSSDNNIRPLWDAIKARGYGSERFILHVGPFSIRLRDENDRDNSSNTNKLEPSLLMFHSHLCRSLADELEKRWQESGRLHMQFDCDVQDINLQTKTLVFTTTDNSNDEGIDSNNNNNNKSTSTTTTTTTNFDLIVGCDGVNSVVRKAMISTWPKNFEATQESIPGLFKVAKLESMPPKLDPTAVQLLFPSKGSVTCFVEPTAKGRCCLLFAGRDPDDMLLLPSSTNNNYNNVTAVEEELMIRYPKLMDADLYSAAEQLVRQGPSQASKVVCNTFHCSSVAALIGDAAHATGGVSGQGVNSAFLDAAQLTNSLIDNYNTIQKQQSLRTALLQYSQKAVPESKALYDLSFGPNQQLMSSIVKLKFLGKNIIDTLFKGRFGIGQRPLNTLLTTSSQSFASIRRERNEFYASEFPNQDQWDLQILQLHEKIINEEEEEPKKEKISSSTSREEKSEIVL